MLPLFIVTKKVPKKSPLVETNIFSSVIDVHLNTLKLWYLPSRYLISSRYLTSYIKHPQASQYFREKWNLPYLIELK